MTEFRCIGAGCCGTVWTSPSEPSTAYKREDGPQRRSILNDFTMHKHLQIVLDSTQLPHRFRIPECHRLISSSDPWWDANSHRFPAGCIPSSAIQAQRIPPMSQPVRDMLVDRYCAAPLRDEIKRSWENLDCLIRPYLGRRRFLNADGRPRAKIFFSLRNLPLHLDQMEELGESLDDIKIYAETMAEALAVMHWRTGIDGNDVEFVLASPPSHGESVVTNVLGAHAVWVLDFDLCRAMPMNEQGVQQTVTAFYRNDPYFPRLRSSPLLWEVFREQSLRCSEMGNAAEIDRRVLHSGLFVRAIEEREATRESY
ncbi:Zinc finger protein [Aspergillus sp. HF37]|nr:Zinc finger protein [Aspergillus sp. HF37]